MRRIARSASPSRGRERGRRDSGPAISPKAISGSTPATGPEMTRRAWIFAALPLCAAAFQAGPAEGAADVFRRAALALRDRKPSALWVLFDSKMPGYSRLRSDAGELLGEAEVLSNIEILR